MRLLNSISQTMERLSVGRTKLYELVNEGRLELVKIGRKSLITEESINSLIAFLLESSRHDR
jgi:excisionase family DNA binding protein